MTNGSAGRYYSGPLHQTVPTRAWSPLPLLPVHSRTVLCGSAMPSSFFSAPGRRLTRHPFCQYGRKPVVRSEGGRKKVEGLSRLRQPHIRRLFLPFRLPAFPPSGLSAFRPFAFPASQLPLFLPYRLSLSHRRFAPSLPASLLLPPCLRFYPHMGVVSRFHCKKSMYTVVYIHCPARLSGLLDPMFYRCYLKMTLIPWRDFLWIDAHSCN